MKLLCFIFLLIFTLAFSFKNINNYRRKNEFCARSCYFRTVSRIAPIQIFGLVSIYIHHPNEKLNKRRYLSEMEAFQNLCWNYRDFTKPCLEKCQNNTLKKWLIKVFFNSLDKYCLKFYENIINNWHCLVKLKRYRRLCDGECAGTCDRTCLYFCYRSVSRRVCRTESPANILLEVNELRSPQQNASQRHPPICINEITSYSKKETRVDY